MHGDWVENPIPIVEMVLKSAGLRSMRKLEKF
jgi:hypothetical protein